MEFRQDVNGLRAIAVAAVVLYHFGARLTTGGFVGVDIFFVISGFLLTSITWREIQAGTFSRHEFLMRRVRRIFPALAAVTLACVVWAGWSFLPGDYNRLVRDAASVLIMRSNYVFHSDTGYFAPDARQNLFLHTWSLSLESQFYLAFAFLCTVFWPRSGTRRRRFGTASFLAVGLGSIAWCVVRTQTDPMSAFYLLASRAWEFMAGSAVAVYGTRKLRVVWAHAAGITGACLLGWSIVAFGPADPYPGWRALFPVAGTALVIFARSGMVTRALSAWPFQFLGRISYSVYIWHWPLLLGYREWTGHDPAGLQTAMLLAGLLLAAWLSWRYIEVPARKGASNRQLITGALAGIVAMFAFSGAISATHGWPQRLPAYQQPVMQATTDPRPTAEQCMREVEGSRPARWPGDFCTIGDARATPTLILWGDSFADRIQAPVDRIAGKLGIAGIVATEGGCPPFRGKVFKGSGAEVFSGCERYANFVFDYFARTPSIRYAVIAGDWQRYDPAYEGEVIRRIATLLAARGGHLVLVAAVPSPGGDLPHQWARRQFQVGHAIRELTVPRDAQARLYGMGQQIAAAASQAGNVTVIDPFESLCTMHACFTVRDGKALFSDTDHLSVAGVDYLVPALANAMAQLREAKAAARQ